MRLFTWIDGLQEWASESPILSAVALCFIGALTIFLANTMGIAQVEFPGVLKAGIKIDHIASSVPVKIDGLMVPKKQVGFLFAPNWSIFLSVSLPIVMCLCLQMRSHIFGALQDMAERKMARDADFEPLSCERLVESWDAERKRSVLLPVLIFVTVIVFMAVDFSRTVAGPILGGLLHPALTIKDPNYEYDWSIACLYSDVAGGCPGNLAFDGLVYLIAAIGAGSIFAAMVDAILFVAFAYGHTSVFPRPGKLPRHGRIPWQLVAAPAEESDDPRCGFEAFENFFISLFFAAIVILPSLLFVILQNTYLRAGAQPNIAQFLHDDWNSAWSAAVALSAHGNIAAAFNSLATYDGATLLNFDTAASVWVFIFVVTFTLGSTYLLLRWGASNAKREATDRLPRLAKEAKRRQQDLKDRLSKMSVWPLGWPNLTEAITILVFMSLAIFSYRFVLFPIAVGLLIIFFRFGRAAYKQMKGGGPPAKRKRAASASRPRRPRSRPAPPQDPLVSGG